MHIAHAHDTTKLNNSYFCFNIFHYIIETVCECAMPLALKTQEHLICLMFSEVSPFLRKSLQHDRSLNPLKCPVHYIALLSSHFMLCLEFWRYRNDSFNAMINISACFEHFFEINLPNTRKYPTNHLKSDANLSQFLTFQKMIHINEIPSRKWKYCLW